MRGIRGCRMREAGARDLDRVAALASLLFADHAAAGPRFALAPGREGELDGLLGEVLRDPERALLVAEREDGNLAGFVALALRRRAGPFDEQLRGSVDWLFVREDARRDGVGRALVEAGFAWLREQGAGRVELEVAHGNRGARAFWRALGFEPEMDVFGRRL